MWLKTNVGWLRVIPSTTLIGSFRNWEALNRGLKRVYLINNQPPEVTSYLLVRWLLRRGY